jgi:hypothetical protein
MVADKRIRTGPGYPASVVEVFQGGDTAFEAEERIPQRRGIAEPSE